MQLFQPPLRVQRGFTILELLIALVILGLIMAMGLPSFRSASARSALSASTMDLIAAINASRAQAVSYRSTVTLAATDGSAWTNGWNVSIPAPHDNENQSFKARENITIVTSGGQTTMNFNRDGTTSAQLVFRVCHDNLTGETGRQITVNRLGRMTNEDFTCS